MRGTRKLDSRYEPDEEADLDLEMDLLSADGEESVVKVTPRYDDPDAGPQYMTADRSDIVALEEMR